ncbi:p26-1 [Sucra jujuba nucleopolyhedrovirus]|uniref:p26-1 n=1 Tax=Sucra jujuba nucleopolyhedrovirus TaxID=1563660 RepID=A0A097P8X4_9ABAC|nr:p26-1 [Sucra jujuba nucleopolyhedrovirus]AIU41249.1 p26-1 [Sucra jujuba nucleopolyhedrovirus]
MCQYQLLVASLLVINFSPNVLASNLSFNDSAINNVRYTIDHLTKTIDIHNVNDSNVNIVIVPPHSVASRREHNLDNFHQFPGVASDIVFSGVKKNDVIHVLLSNGVLYRTTSDRVYTNFHVDKHRMIYGQLPTFATDDFSLADKIYIGAPIFRNGKLASVITCRFDDYKNGLVLFPVSGVRTQDLVSGQIHFDESVFVKKLLPDMSVYGRKQLPYRQNNDLQNHTSTLNVKRFALAATNNRQMYRDWPRSVVVFYNDRNIFISLVEGEFEINRVRFSGPLIEPQQ